MWPAQGLSLALGRRCNMEDEPGPGSQMGLPKAFLSHSSKLTSLTSEGYCGHSVSEDQKAWNDLVTVSFLIAVICQKCHCYSCYGGGSVPCSEALSHFPRGRTQK